MVASGAERLLMTWYLGDSSGNSQGMGVRDGIQGPLEAKHLVPHTEPSHRSFPYFGWWINRSLSAHTVFCFSICMPVDNCMGPLVSCKSSVNLVVEIFLASGDMQAHDSFFNTHCSPQSGSHIFQHTVYSHRYTLNIHEAKSMVYLCLFCFVWLFVS